MVGEAGLSPQYFKRELTFSEARLIIQGLQRRYRPTYESARMLHGCIGGLFAKDYKLPEFPWDHELKHRDTSHPSHDEIRQLMQEAQDMERRLNSSHI